jgi:hypothetical protein
MSRKVCLLPWNCPAEEFAEHLRSHRHEHTTRTRADAREKLGELVAIDESRKIFAERPKMKQRRGSVPRRNPNPIPESVILTALDNKGLAGEEALLKIASLDARPVALAGVRVFTPQPGVEDGHSMLVAPRVVVLVRLLHPEITARVWKFLNIRAQHQRARANEILDELWPEVALWFVAGLATERLNSALGRELSSVFVDRVLRSYLGEAKTDLQFWEEGAVSIILQARLDAELSQVCVASAIGKSQMWLSQAERDIIPLSAARRNKILKAIQELVRFREQVRQGQMALNKELHLGATR